MMKHTLKGMAVLSALLFVGAGCSFLSPTEPTDDAMMTDDNMEDSDMMKQDAAAMMEGETMLKDDAMKGDAMNDDTMVGGDAMVGDDDTVMIKNDAMMKQDDAAMVKDDAVMEEPMMMTKGSYEAYSPEKLANAKTGDVVLFFHAGWCPTCKALDGSLAGASIPDGLTILKTDYDANAELKKMYGVTYQHTLVQVDADGKLIKKWSGGNTLESITSQVQ